MNNENYSFDPGNDQPSFNNPSQNIPGQGQPYENLPPQNLREPQTKSKTYNTLRNISLLLIIFSIICLVLGYIIVSLGAHEFESAIGLFTISAVVIGLLIGIAYLVLGRKTRNTFYYIFLALVIVLTIGVIFWIVETTIKFNEAMHPIIKKIQVNTSQSSNAPKPTGNDCSLITVQEMSSILQVKGISQKPIDDWECRYILSPSENMNVDLIQTDKMSKLDRQIDGDAKSLFYKTREEYQPIDYQNITGLGQDAGWVEGQQLDVLVSDNTYLRIRFRPQTQPYPYKLAAFKALANIAIPRIK